MNPAAPDGAPPQRISAGKHMGKHRTAPPCLGEALRREAIMPGFIDFHGLGVNTLLMHVSTESGIFFRKWEARVGGGR